MKTEEFTRMMRGIVLSSRRFSKIFGIGCNKTGTTTLEGVLRLYGYSIAPQFLQEVNLTEQTHSGYFEPFRRFCAEYDAFQDRPFSEESVYIIADALFPNSKFILTERDPDEWFDSTCRFHEKNFGIQNLKAATEQDIREKHSYCYEGYGYANKKRFLTTFENGEKVVRWDLLYNREFYIGRYTNRNNQIKKYFDGREDDLLVIDVTREATTARICEFLGIHPKYAVAMPHMNKT